MMTTRLLSLALLAAVPAAAQDWSFEAALQASRDSLRDYTVQGPGGSLTVSPAGHTGLALRGAAVRTLDPRWAFETSLGFRLRSTGSLAFSNTAGRIGTLDVRQALPSQLILGAAFRGRVPFLWSAGLDLRSERLSVEAGSASSAATLTRPWFRATARWDFDGPFVGLALAVPLTKDTPSGEAYLSDLDHLGGPSNPEAGAAARAHAPQSEIGLLVGYRFLRR